MDSRAGAAVAFAAGAALGATALYFCTRPQPPDHMSNAAAGSQALPSSVAATAATAAEPAGSTCTAGLRDFEQDEILAEQLTRNVQFFGLEAQKTIGGSFVVVVGLGGVGSHAAHLLLRSGVGRLRLIDFDQVTLSSLNRHCLATRADVGLPKATVLARHFKGTLNADAHCEASCDCTVYIVPEAAVEARVQMYTREGEEALLGGGPDFVIDAIDNIDTKVDLLAACKRRGIPMLCCAGAGAKADPTRLRLVDVAEAAADPLARAVRHRLRRDHGITEGLTILLSAEKPRCGLVYGGEEGANPLDYQVMPNFRIRTIPVLGTTPALFGMAAAAHVLCALAGQPFTPQPHFLVQPRQFTGIYDALVEREELRFGTAEAVGVDAAEVEALVKDVWRGHSARRPHPPSNDKGITRSVGHLTLTRWDPSRAATVDNLVLLTHAEADEHEQQQSLEELRRREPELCRRVEAVLSRARHDFMWRC
ncbi:tRNA threonylcarbamoyladenosine dehydratase [Chlorella vulgaris]